MDGGAWAGLRLAEAIRLMPGESRGYWNLPADTVGNFRIQTDIYSGPFFDMQQRYYDPLLGRFLSVDPVTANSGTGANFNRYWYANNNPYKFKDPDGRQSTDIKPLQIYQIQVRTVTTNGAVKVERQTVTNRGIVGGKTVEQRGSVLLLPQRSANGAPASPGEKVTTRLLNFSDKAGKTVSVTSGQRTPEQNASVGGAAASQHLQDNAADIKIDGYTKGQTADAAHDSGEFNRVNEYPDNRGVHVDLKEGGNQGKFYNWSLQSE